MFLYELLCAICCALIYAVENKSANKALLCATVYRSANKSALYALIYVVKFKCANFSAFIFVNISGRRLKRLNKLHNFTTTPRPTSSLNWDKIRGGAAHPLGSGETSAPPWFTAPLALGCNNKTVLYMGPFQGRNLTAAYITCL